MRRLLNTLMILLLVLVAGLSALVMLVNPDDFRGYLVQSAAKEGYQLTLEGPLRWHVWPGLSILTGRMTLSAAGGSEPLVSAENTRLDVALLPLLSHQLRVNHMMLKNAVIQLSEQSQPSRPASAPIAPDDKQPLPTGQGWGLSIGKITLSDSLLVLQPQGGDPLTVRDLNATLLQQDDRYSELSFSARITRNQQVLSFSGNARLDSQDYPGQFSARVERLSYQLQGANMLAQGIRGEGSADVQWRNASRTLSLFALKLTANNSQLSGQGTFIWQTQPRLQLALQFPYLDLDQLLITENSDGQPLYGGTPGQQAAPVIASTLSAGYRNLRDFSADISLNAEQLRWHGLTFGQVIARLDNQRGLLRIAPLQGQFGGGTIALPGQLDVRGQQALFRFQPDLQGVPLAELLRAFGYPAPFSGALTLSGDFSGDTLSAPALRQHWQGQAQLQIHPLGLNGLNIEQLVDQALARGNRPPSPDRTNHTRLARFSAHVALDNGQLSLTQLDGESRQFAISGAARLDLVRQQCDARLNIHLRLNPGMDDRLQTLLKNTPLPLQIYGDWDALNYRFQPGQLLQDQLRDELRRRWRQWRDSPSHSGQ